MTSEFVIDKGIKHWCTRLRLRACIDANGGHVEHKLYRLVQNNCIHEHFKFFKNLSAIDDFTPTYL